MHVFVALFVQLLNFIENVEHSLLKILWDERYRDQTPQYVEPDRHADDATKDRLTTALIEER